MDIPTWAPGFAVSTVGLGLSFIVATRSAAAATKKAWTDDEAERARWRAELQEITLRVQAIEDLCTHREALSGRDFSAIRDSLATLRERVNEFVKEIKEAQKERRR